MIIFCYAFFFGIVVTGQQNTKLLIQYKLTNIFDTKNVSIILGLIVATSRLSRLLGSFYFGRVYYKIRNKAVLILTVMLFISFAFTTLGFFIKFEVIRFILMSIGLCIILAIRDPFRLYINDTILKICKPSEKQKAISYMEFGKKTGITICSLLIAAILLRWEMIYVIIGIGLLSIFEIFIAIKLYSMLILKENDNKKYEKEKITI